MSMSDAASKRSILEEVFTKLQVVRGPDARGRYLAWCVFHPDGQGTPPHKPNLNISERGFHCFACGEKGNLMQLAEKLGVNVKADGRNPEAVYDYRDEKGNLLFQVVSFRGKRFRQRRPDGKGGWIWDLEGVRRVLYRLQELLAAHPDETIYIVEGEKDCDRLMNAGLVATTNPGGAGKWRAEYNEPLRGRAVVILSDNDNP